jgi:3-oxoacyl-[acyl-carrier-protein] synthase-3
MERFYATLDSVCVSDVAVKRIVKTAKVVARLYRLQLEEMEHDLK